MKRVAVTGIGAVTPIGNDIQSLYEGLREGRNGIGYITRFDPEEYKVKVAAEVKISIRCNILRKISFEKWICIRSTL